MNTFKYFILGFSAAVLLSDTVMSQAAINIPDGPVTPYAGTLMMHHHELEDFKAHSSQNYPRPYPYPYHYYSNYSRNHHLVQH